MNNRVGMFDIAELRLHPAADRVPRPDSADRAALKADLEENGQLDPIDITADRLILDGRTRTELLGEIGSRTVLGRIVDVPEADQPAYIVRRAVNRRHLTAAQKHDLIRYLASLVIEVGPKGEQVGMTEGEIAAAVGVSLNTVKRAKEPDGPFGLSGSPRPTHVRTANPETPGTTKLQRVSRPATKRPPKTPPPPRRKYPGWWRKAGLWLRRARKEDATALRELDERVHAAMSAAGIGET